MGILVLTMLMLMDSSFVKAATAAVGVSSLRFPCGIPFFRKCQDSLPEAVKLLKEQTDRYMAAIDLGRFVNFDPSVEGDYTAQGRARLEICKFFGSAPGVSPCPSKKAKIKCSKDLQQTIICRLDLTFAEYERSVQRRVFYQLVLKNLGDVIRDFQEHRELKLGSSCDWLIKDPEYHEAMVGYVETATAYSNGGPVQPSCGPPDSIGYSQQWACYADAVRNSLEILNVPSLFCEVFARAERQWSITEKIRFEKLPQDLAEKAVLGEPCKNKRVASLGDFEKCVQSQYESAILRDYPAMMEGLKHDIP